MKHSLSISQSRLIKIGLLFLLFNLSIPAFAQRVEFIPIQYRAAEDIADQIKALYPEQQVRVTGINQQLTVRADQHIIDEIKQLVASLDTAPHQFLINVSSDENQHQTSSGISGNITSSTRSSNGSTNIEIKTHNKTFQTRGGGNQSIRVLEGHSAYINAGQKKPVRSRQIVNGQWTNNVDYIDMTSGVYVEPRLVGSNQVELKIRSQKNKASQQHYNEIDTATIDSVQIIQLGEWTNIGGSYQNRQTSNSGISYSTQRQNIDNQGLKIKIDLIAN